MENKQKQIEEIKKYMRYFCVTETMLKYCRYEVEKEIEKQKEFYATALYNAGYRKIPKNAVVLSREEHIQMIKDLAESNAKTYETAYERGSKETAEKFAERLKDKLNEFLDDNEDNDGKINKGICLIEVIGVVAKDGEVISLGLIDEIANEITEGEKEISNETI